MKGRGIPVECPIYKKMKTKQQKGEKRARKVLKRKRKQRASIKVK